MQLKDKMITLSLSIVMVISFGFYFLGAHVDNIGAETLSGDLLSQRSTYQPTYKSSRLFPDAGSVTPRRVDITPVGSSTQGIVPDRISIPSIDVDTSIEDVGILPDGKMGVPDDGDQVGWFNRGPKPGAAGQAVMAGHVDDQNGPAIFYHLDELEKGDVVKVHNDQGDERIFRVTHKKVYPYDEKNIEEVFGPTSQSNLNLITCTGEFDRQAGTHRERLVVFTEEMTQ
ncbi:class F sortase [Pelagirhabdus alkalitolerans]|nr:class F sortase [Pelagirhabdus alkalitolerans]